MPILYQDEVSFGQDFLADIVEWVAQNLVPSEVYTGPYAITLESWAEDWADNNGYIKEE
jgi:hypothetical protein